MIDIKRIREQPEFIQKEVKSKGVDMSIESILDLDAKRRGILQEVEGLNLVGRNIRADQFLTCVTLPAVGRIVRLEARRQHGASVGAGTTGNGRVDELDVRIGHRKHTNHGVKTCGLTTTGPP